MGTFENRDTIWELVDVEQDGEGRRYSVTEALVLEAGVLYRTRYYVGEGASVAMVFVAGEEKG